MKSFKDPSLKNGLFLLDLLSTIEPRAVNPEIITPGEKLCLNRFGIFVLPVEGN